MNKLLRTGRIHDLSDHDKAFLEEYGLKKIIDLRSKDERENCPDDKITGTEHFDLALSETDNTKGGVKDTAETFKQYRVDQYAGFKMMCQRYYGHIHNEHAQHAIKKILEVLANNQDGAVLYHCSEGKDRTGIVTVIVLYILGVDMETIRQDYLYSNYMLNDYRAKRDAMFKKNGENLIFRSNMRMLGSVNDAFFDTALITIEKDFGGMDNFIEKQLGVTPELKEALREIYLEKR